VGVSTAADENKRFADEFAKPHSWLMMADNLHEQATEIYRKRSRSSIVTRVNGKGEMALIALVVGLFKVGRIEGAIR
jgi:hypothetical protein